MQRPAFSLLTYSRIPYLSTPKSKGGITMKASQLTKENITPEIVDKLLFEGLDYKGETADVIIVLGSRKACDYRVPLAAKLFHKGKAPQTRFLPRKSAENLAGGNG